MCQYCEYGNDIKTWCARLTDIQIDRWKNNAEKNVNNQKWWSTHQPKNPTQHTMRSQPNAVTACRLLLLLSSTLFRVCYLLQISFLVRSLVLLGVFVCVSVSVYPPVFISRSLDLWKQFIPQYFSASTSKYSFRHRRKLKKKNQIVLLYTIAWTSY